MSVIIPMGPGLQHCSHVQAMPSLVGLWRKVILEFELDTLAFGDPMCVNLFCCCRYSLQFHSRSHDARSCDIDLATGCVIPVWSYCSKLLLSFYG